MQEKKENSCICNTIPNLTCVLESGRSQAMVPLRLSSAILALSLWAKTMVRGMHSSVSSVAYPNIRPCRAERVSEKKLKDANCEINKQIDE